MLLEPVSSCLRSKFPCGGEDYGFIRLYEGISKCLTT